MKQNPSAVGTLFLYSSPMVPYAHAGHKPLPRPLPLYRLLPNLKVPGLPQNSPSLARSPFLPQVL